MQAQVRRLHGAKVVSPARLDMMLDEIAHFLIRVKVPRGLYAATERYERALVSWLRDEGDTTPERLAYWYTVILTNARDDFFDAFMAVMRACDRSVVQSILHSLDKQVEALGLRGEPCAPRLSA